MKSKKDSPEDERLTPAQKLRREIIAWFWVALAFLLINGTIGQARVIPSGSMQDTLLIGDHLIMSRIGYDAGIPFTNIHVPLWRDPKRQQVVIFKPPFAPDTPDYVKRVIGLPGETVDVHDGGVYINGRRLAETYTRGRSERPDQNNLMPNTTNYRGLPFTVPKNCYFVMGDNRENSLDSRFWGCVPRNDIIGTPVLIYMSLNVGEDPWQPGQIRERVFAYGNALIHPGLVRWKRLFRTF